MMKNTTDKNKPYYTIEVYCARSSWDYPEWHNESTHKTLDQARAKKVLLIKADQWAKREVRIVEFTRKVIR